MAFEEFWKESGSQNPRWKLEAKSVLKEKQSKLPIWDVTGVFLFPL